MHRSLARQVDGDYHSRRPIMHSSTGDDNEGNPLSKIMPRWRLSQRDLHDVAVYVLSQSK